MSSAVTVMRAVDAHVESCDCYVDMSSAVIVMRAVDAHVECCDCYADC